jgi:uncharacterized membrane protein
VLLPLLVAPLIISTTLGAIGVLGVRRRLPRNGFVGIRLPSTMRSDRAWRAAHHAAGPYLLAAAVPSVPLALAMREAPPDRLGAVSMIAMSPSILLLLVGSWRAHVVARHIPPHDPRRPWSEP